MLRRELAVGRNRQGRQPFRKSAGVDVDAEPVPGLQHRVGRIDADVQGERLSGRDEFAASRSR